MSNSPNAIILFSGGLDSILCAKILEAQGLNVLCVHFTTPFFGNAKHLDRWSTLHDLNIIHKDISQPFLSLLTESPKHGFGKTMNPCIDCKILQMQEAVTLMHEYNAQFIASGEVVGQRPMSQRKNTMNLIANAAGVSDILVRPLSALLLKPTVVEISGLVDRKKLYAISGRGRKEQLELSEKFALKEIPTPAGGCRLTEKENSRRYWQVIKTSLKTKLVKNNIIDDLNLANHGRQLWRHYKGHSYCLYIGRNEKDNAELLNARKTSDITLKLQDHPGPLALARYGSIWPREILIEAAAAMAARASKHLFEIKCLLVSARGNNFDMIFEVKPNPMIDTWTLPDWEILKKELREFTGSINE